MHVASEIYQPEVQHLLPVSFTFCAVEVGSDKGDD